MSKIYDVIIIGASNAGIDAYLALRKQLSVLVVSTDFSGTTSGHTIANVDRLQNTVVYAEYRRGLIILTLADHSLICSTRVIIATGACPKQSSLKTNNLYYKTSDIKTKSKSAPVAIIGSTTEAALAALDLSKKFNYVYICNEDKQLHCGNQLALEVFNSKNIVHLPLCSIIKCRNDDTGKLKEIELSTYEVIKCSNILIATDHYPNDCGVPANLVIKDNDNYIITKDGFKTTVVPNIYAIGTCVKESIADSGKLVAEYILNGGK